MAKSKTPPVVDPVPVAAAAAAVAEPAPAAADELDSLGELGGDEAAEPVAGAVVPDVAPDVVPDVVPAVEVSGSAAPAGGEDEPVLKLTDAGEEACGVEIDMGQATVTVVRPPERLDCAEDILAWRDAPQREITYINEQLALIKKNMAARLAELDDDRIRRGERAQVLLETLRVHGKCLAEVEEARMLARPF